VNSIVLSTYTWALTLGDSARTALHKGLAALAPEDGQDIIEYAVIVGAIALVASVAIWAFDLPTVMSAAAGKICDAVDLGGTGCAAP
jgi:Flp pilus assembly pilin Flp